MKTTESSLSTPPRTDAGLRVVSTAAEMRAERELARASGHRVAFVPTMGYLHDGHLSLIELGRRHADVVVLSIYVNPTQFGPTEDLESYPRDLTRDLDLAAERGVDIVFAPADREMYPVPQTVWVEPPAEMSARLCGLSRPTHFRGVLTVVLKLFEIVQPDVAVFGRKDYQQALLVRRMVRELHLPVRIELAPIVREPDGLAMSSRNAGLSAVERAAALSLSGALREVRGKFRAGERSADALRGLAVDLLEQGGVIVDYVEIVDPADLSPVSKPDGKSVCAIAGFAGEVRLIDNAPLDGPSSLDAPGE